jgi:hypothetical protein
MYVEFQLVKTQHTVTGVCQDTFVELCQGLLHLSKKGRYSAKMSEAEVEQITK